MILYFGVSWGVPTKTSTTSYALLGLLAIEPLSAYDLTKYMRRSALARLWPRTEASIYREPKILEYLGLASSHSTATGARTRTVYSITPRGKRALRDWLATPSSPMTFECEAAVKAFFADAGDLPTLRSILRDIAEEPTISGHATLGIVRDLAGGRGRYPNRLHLSAMAADLITEMSLARVRWARRWLARTERWESTLLDATAERDARLALSSITSRIERAIGNR
jgi:PadR family transcriptional regulator, regulatory protein AphA